MAAASEQRLADRRGRMRKADTGQPDRAGPPPRGGQSRRPPPGLVSATGSAGAARCAVVLDANGNCTIYRHDRRRLALFTGNVDVNAPT